MISWIQKYFQQHFRVMFAILLGATIVSFVFVFNASSGFGSGDRANRVARPFFGYNLSDPADERRIGSDAQLSYSFNMRYDVRRLQDFALERVAALHLANEWHIPTTTQAEIAEALKKMRMFAGPNGEFDGASYQKFRDNLKAQPGGLDGALTEADIARVIGDDIRIEKVNKLLSGPGYVLPGDVKTQLEREDTTWTIATATTDYTAFKPEIKPTEAELTKAFEESGGRYDVPPRLVVSLVEFPAAQYAAQVKLSDSDVRAHYEANKASFPKPEAPKPTTPPGAPATTPAADPEADFAAVRPQVEKALREQKARAAAASAASNLRVDLDRARVANLDAANAFLASRQLAAKTLAPFARGTGPAELGGSAEIGEVASRLSKERFISDTIETPNGAGIFFWQDLQPARKPGFAEVRERVSTDYIETERQKRFLDALRTARTQIETRVKGGEAFDKAAAAVATAGLKFDAKAFPAFKRPSAPPELQEIRNSLEGLKAGQISEPVRPSEAKAVFIHVAEKKAPDLTEANPRYVEVRKQLAQFAAVTGASNYLSELAERELKKSEPKAQ